jgi:aryl-phospho-beta-D-glucosidase BglC (GH1 family)
MVNTNTGRSFPRRTVYVATAFALLAVVAGFGIAASFTVTSGPALAGSGEYHATTSIAWWSETDVGVSVQPTALPTTASATVGSPTVLVAGTSYGVNAAVANDVAQYWKFSEATTVSVNTELEVSFTVSTGAGPTITTLTVYIETQAVAPGAAVTFGFYYDLGNAVTTTITLNSVTEISQQCSAVGTCP